MTDTTETIKKKTPYGPVQLVKDVVIIVAMYLVFTAFGYASFHIPSGSMEPTLEVGDRVFVSKFSYGYNKYSFFFDPDFVGDERILEDAPERGDVVVFSLNDTDFIKRVIGLPGDVIMMRAGRLYINNKQVEREAVRTFQYTTYKGRTRRVTEYIETLPGGVKHRIYESSDSDTFDNTDPVQVPPGHYFMMGDNRDESADSRNMRGRDAMGFVDKKFLVGRADITTISFYDCDQGKPGISCPIGIPLGRFFRGLD